MVAKSFLTDLQSRIDPTSWIDDPLVIAPHLHEWRGLFQGKTPVMLKPDNTDELATIVSLCAEHKIALVPQGGNTGLVGGGVPDESGNEILLNTSRLNRILEIDAVNYSITVEAGCILADVQQAAEKAGRFFPLSLASEGSCQIGGNISSNAGGINVLRYGNMRDLVLGLEVVLPNGQIWDGLKKLRKDNTGYNLKQLFIGAEGTLGIITKACLKLFPPQKEKVTALVAVPSVSAAVELLAVAREVANDALIAFELLPAIGIEFVTKHIPNTRSPFQENHPWYVLLELASSQNNSRLMQTVEILLTHASDKKIILDGIIAKNSDEAQQLRKLRESMSEAQKPEGGSIKHDIAVPISKISEFIELATKAVKTYLPSCRPVPFGHIGDGNIHFNISQPIGMDKKEFLAHWSKVNCIVHDIVASMNGSISAEHGIGRLKADELEIYKSRLEVELMQKLKETLDPINILNPKRILK